MLIRYKNSQPWKKLCAYPFIKLNTVLLFLNLTYYMIEKIK